MTKATQEELVAAIEAEFQAQSKALDEVEQSYNVWDNELTIAETELNLIQSQIEQICGNSGNLEETIDFLRNRYVELENEVTKLEKQYPKSLAVSNDRDNLKIKAKSLLEYMRKLKEDLDEAVQKSSISSVRKQLADLEELEQRIKKIQNDPAIQKIVAP